MFQKLYSSLFIFFMKLTPGKSFVFHVAGSYIMIGVYSLSLSSFTATCGMYPLSSSQSTGMVPFGSVEAGLGRKEERLKEISSILKNVHQQLIEIQPVIVDCFNSKKYSDYIHSAHYTRIYDSSLLHNMKAENMSSLPRLDFSQMPQRIELTCYITNGSDSLVFPVTHNLASEVNLTGGLSPQTLAVLNST